MQRVRAAFWLDRNRSGPSDRNCKSLRLWSDSALGHQRFRRGLTGLAGWSRAKLSTGAIPALGHQPPIWRRLRVVVPRHPKNSLDIG